MIGDNGSSPVTSILLRSREVYEKYSAPLGIGWMVQPATHYGCSFDGYEYDRWGTYHRADHLGIGVDRTDKGTGYALQYNEPNASEYKNVRMNLSCFFIIFRIRIGFTAARP